ncbi:hypothetical protein QOZ80_5AG0385130 [Eleusine coracana subsp. coracana]|nr:hypothetical protein QOZ80_5AG0385130 [Eleusine coracana subsp. coracana]
MAEHGDSPVAKRCKLASSTLGVEESEAEGSGHNPEQSVIRWCSPPLALSDSIVRLVDRIAAIRLMTIGKEERKQVMKQHGLIPGVPMLLTLASTPEGQIEEPDVLFGSFALHIIRQGKTRTSSSQSVLEVLKGRSWLAVKDDWLITIDQEFSLSLVNPITSKSILLPPLSSNSDRNEELLSDFMKNDDAGGHGPLFIECAVLYKTPRQDGGPFVILLFSSGNIMYPEKTNGMWMTLPNTDRFATRFVDAAYWEERYMVAIGQWGSMKFWDLSMKPIITESPK